MLFRNIKVASVIIIIFSSTILLSLLCQIAIGQAVHIPDPGLRAIIVSALGKKDGDDVTYTEITNLKVLYADDSDIRDLTGIEYAANITELRIGKNRISDLSPLKDMKNLSTLDVHSNWKKYDLSPIKNLTNLTWLSLRLNRISDLSPLKDLKNLTYLNLNDNKNISDVTPLKDLINLRHLSLDENEISDVSSLKDLTNLRFLAIDDNHVADITPLEKLTKLTYLNLNDNKYISDITPIKSMTNLKFLDLHGNMIVDITTLNSLINMEDLRLQENNIIDVSPLRNMIKLFYLDLHDNNINNVVSLQDLTNLKYLDLRKNKISDFSPLDTLTEKLIDYFTDQYSKSVDVNRDGVVNIVDLVIVALNYRNPKFADYAGVNIYPDVNNDGVIDIKDLIEVAATIDASIAAPILLKYPVATSNLKVDNVTQWIQLAGKLEGQGPRIQKGISVLHSLLTILLEVENLPQMTALLSNYPNPFNPETWIPFQLARPAVVSISIHTSQGKIVRNLDLGHLPAGVYHNKSRAAYWNGQNESGESVASGVYFYTLTTTDYIDTGKMIIRK